MSILRRRLVRVAAAVVAVVALAALPTGANASLIGDTITVSTEANIFPGPPVTTDTWTDTFVVVDDISNPELAGDDGSDHATAGPTSMFADLFTGDSIDVGANSVTFIYAALGEGGINYAFTTTFTGLDWVGPDGPGELQSVAFASGAMGLLSGAQANFLSASSFEFSGTVVLGTGANFTIDLTAVHTPISAVPIPAALPLFLSALAGLGLMGWRRRQAVG